MSAHHLIPLPRCTAVGAADRDQLDRLKLLQSPAPWLLCACCRPLFALALVRPSCKLPRCLQSDLSSPIQLQKRHSTTHLFQLPFPCSPPQPLADLPRQCRSRQAGIIVNRRLDSKYRLLTEFLPADSHFGQSTKLHPPCPVKTLMGHS